MQTRRLLAATSAIAVLGLAACSGESGSDSSRPDAAQVADTLSADEGFEELGITDDQLMCVSQAYVDSDLSDEALQALIGGDEEYVPSEEDQTVLTDLITGAAGECFSEG